MADKSGPQRDSAAAAEWIDNLCLQHPSLSDVRVALEHVSTCKLCIAKLSIVARWRVSAVLETLSNRLDSEKKVADSE